MVSTFGILNSAYSGLNAARTGLDVTGQNITNANTTGYTRQRVEQQGLSGVSGTSSVLVQGATIGAGVQVTGISRLNDSLADAQVYSTASTSGYWTQASSALSTVETATNEPSDTGLTETMNSFWSAWSTMSNNTGDASSANVLISDANTLASQIKTGYQAMSDAWSNSQSALSGTVTQINSDASQIASLNKQIQATTAAGGNANTLIDQRSTLVTSLAGLTGATSRANTDGTIDVVVAGNALVSGTSSRTLTVAGATRIEDASTNPVHLEWTDHPGVTADVAGGEVAGRLATLAGANASGTGGTYAEAAKVYNTLASTIASKVNTLHEAGTTSTGATGLDFFKVDPTKPAALGLSVIPTSVAGVAAAATGAGANDGSVADSISQLGTGSGSPNAVWANFVSQIGALSQNATTQATVAANGATSAVSTQTSASGVDLDEETSNLVLYQHAYQGAARVMTAIDQMLDTLINHTGIVGVS